MPERQYTLNIQWLKKDANYGILFLVLFWLGIVALIISLPLGFIGYNDFKHDPKVISFFSNFIGFGGPDFSNCNIFNWGNFCLGGSSFVKYHNNVIVAELRLEHIPMQIQNYGRIFFVLFIVSMPLLGVGLIGQIACASYIASKSGLFEEVYETNIKTISIISIFLGMFTAPILKRKMWKAISEPKAYDDSNNPSWDY